MMMKMLLHGCLLRQRFTLHRHFSSLSTATKVPVLYKSPQINESNHNDAVTLQLFSWGRGASGQLGSGIEEIRLYPAPVANLQLLSSSFTLSPTPGQLVDNNYKKGVTEVGISCGLFHSAILADGHFWMWGKGDGGRLGFGHENPAFLPTLNPFLDSVRSIALGGIHSVALTSLGQIFTWGYGGFGALGHSVYHRELIPRLVEGSWDGKIRDISTSGTHTAAITKSGEVYTWGREEGDGRLGLGPGRGPNEGGGLSIPCKVKALPVPVAAVSCGGFFTVVLTEEGQVWNWGGKDDILICRMFAVFLSHCSDAIICSIFQSAVKELNRAICSVFEGNQKNNIFVSLVEQPLGLNNNLLKSCICETCDKGWHWSCGHAVS